MSLSTSSLRKQSYSLHRSHKQYISINFRFNNGRHAGVHWIYVWIVLHNVDKEFLASSNKISKENLIEGVAFCQQFVEWNCRLIACLQLLTHLTLSVKWKLKVIIKIKCSLCKSIKDVKEVYMYGFFRSQSLCKIHFTITSIFLLRFQEKDWSNGMHL